MDFKIIGHYKSGSIMSRILITLLGIGMILWGISTLSLGLFGKHATGVLKSISRQGGERAESIPNRYTYSIGYAFNLPDGRHIEASSTRIGDSVYVKPSGTSTVSIRYFKFAPFINALEDDTRLSLGQPVLISAGVLLIVSMNKRQRTKKL